MEPERITVPVPRTVRPIVLVLIVLPELVDHVVLMMLLVRVKLVPLASKPKLPLMPLVTPGAVMMVVALSRFASRVETVLVVKAPVKVPTPKARVPALSPTILEVVQRAVLPP